MRFTDKQIQALKPHEKPYVVTADSDSRGIGRLQLKVYPSGTKKFQFQYFLNRARKRMEIGTYGAMTLAEARKKYLSLSDIVQSGDNPKEITEKKKKNKEIVAAQKYMVEMVNDFYMYIEKNWAKNTVKRTVNCFKANLLPFIDDKLLPSEFTPDYARELIYKVYNRGAKEQANVFRSDLFGLFKFAINFDNSPEQFKKPDWYNVKVNPIRDISFSTPKKAGTRWLNEDEIYELWHSTTLPITAKRYIQLSLVTGGQRVNELYKCVDSEFDLREMTFCIPVERVKVKSRGAHIVPLSELALPIIKELKLTRGKIGQYWPHKSRENDFAVVSTLRMAIIRWCELNKVPLFTTRDLRRTCKTLMGKAGISKFHKDLLQQHNKRNDVSSINYDRYDYLNEKRVAMAQWTEYLKTIIKIKN